MIKQGFFSTMDALNKVELLKAKHQLKHEQNKDQYEKPITENK